MDKSNIFFVWFSYWKKTLLIFKIAFMMITKNKKTKAERIQHPQKQTRPSLCDFKRCLARFVSTFFRIIYNVKRCFWNICVTVINSKDRGRMICYLLDNVHLRYIRLNQLADKKHKFRLNKITQFTTNLLNKNLSQIKEQGCQFEQ